MNDPALQGGIQATHASPADSPDIDENHAAAPSMPRPASPQILVLSDEGEKTYDLYEVLTVGRVESNDIWLRDPRASKRHCEVRYEDGRYYLRDLGSANGTIVNGHYADVKPLDHGDRMLIGRTSLLFLCPLELTEPPPIEERPAPTPASSPQLWGEGEQENAALEVPSLADAEPDETADVQAERPSAGDISSENAEQPDEIEEAFRTMADTQDDGAQPLPTWAAQGASDDIVTGDAPVTTDNGDRDDVREDEQPHRKPYAPPDEVVRLLFDDASLDGAPTPFFDAPSDDDLAAAKASATANVAAATPDDDNDDNDDEGAAAQTSASSDLRLDPAPLRPDDMRSTDSALAPPKRRYGSRGTLDEPATVSDEPLPPDIRAKIERIAGHASVVRAHEDPGSGSEAGEARSQPPIRAQTRPPHPSQASPFSPSTYEFMSTLARLRKEAEAIGDPREQMHVIYALEVLLSTPFLPEALDQIERRKP